MRFFSLAAAALFGASAVNAYFLPKDYPNNCATWCGPVVTASQSCEDNPPSCICEVAHMKRLVPLCSACAKVQKQGGDGNKDGFAGKVTQLIGICDYKESHREFSGASGPVSPALGAGALAAVAAMAVL